MAEAIKELKWVLTEHGKKRITEVLSNPTDRIRINCIHIGRSNEGDFRARETINELLEPISYEEETGVYTKDISIYEKGISDELENTVYFKALIDENISGFEIKELALFEEIGNQLYMFAVGIGEPINKPALDKGYVISIDYTLLIESANLYDIYDKIELDPDNEFIKEVDVENIYQSILFVEANLAEQISKNTHMLGLGRVQQLDDLINKNMLSYNSMSISNYYANLANSVKDLKNILGCWSFNYTDVYGTTQVIKDFSGHGLNISVNAPLSTYDQDYIGLLSTLNFTPNDYFVVDKVDVATASSDKLELGELINHDYQDTIVYNAALDIWTDGLNIYTQQEIKDNFLMYYTPATTATQNTASESRFILSENVKSTARAPHTWTCSIVGDDSIKWTNELGVVYQDYDFKEKVVSYLTDSTHKGPAAGDTITIGGGVNPQNGASITFSGEQFDLINYRWVDKIYNGSTIRLQEYYDSDFTFIAMLEHNNPNEDNILLAQSDYTHGVHNFEIKKTKNNAIELVLFTSPTNYIKYSTADHVVPTSVYNLILSYDTSGYNPTLNVFINGAKYAVTTSGPTNAEGKFTYEGMQPNVLSTTSYVSRVNPETGIIEKHNGINAKVGFMGLIKEKLSSEILRCNSLFLNSLCGKNVYFKV